MKILVLGAAGMLGHKMAQVLIENKFEVTGTIRGRAAEYASHPILGKVRLIGGVQAESFDSIVGAMAQVRPDAVVNCIGIVKQQAASKDPIPSLTINSLFPHRLAKLCRAADCRLVHISTDCVFSGLKGNYKESDTPDADDLYGRTKLLGEVSGEGSLTLRTSIIGPELGPPHGLLGWFLSNAGGSVKGFSKAIFSGLTTRALSIVIARVLSEQPNMSGLWHVAADPISKLDLLKLIRQFYHLDTHISPDDGLRIDRSLDGSRFREATGIVPPTWPVMIDEMHRDPS